MENTLDLGKTPFSLNHSLSCGQTFRWHKRDDWWIGVVGQSIVKVRQIGNALEFHTSSRQADAAFLRRYFRLDDDLPSIYSRIAKDQFLRKAIDKFYGLRLIRQDPWECLASFICATFKNIPAIKQMVLSLSERLGTALRFGGERFHTFPSPAALGGASVRELRLCKLGFRAERISQTAKLIDSGKFDLLALNKESYPQAKNALLTLPGVGPKVADCVLLFSLDKLEAFPIDVWMKRLIVERYSERFQPEFLARIRLRNSLSLRDYQTIYDFGRGYFGEYVGYAQEYLYHYERCQHGLSEL